MSRINRTREGDVSLWIAKVTRRSDYVEGKPTSPTEKTTDAKVNIVLTALAFAPCKPFVRLLSSVGIGNKAIMTATPTNVL